MPTVNAPTSDEIYEKSRLRWQKLGVASASDLDDPVLEAIAYVLTVTGRYFSDWAAPTSFEGGLPLDTAAELVPLAKQAVRMRTEQIVMQSQPGYIDTATDDVVQSISVGSYSETRRDPTKRGEQKTLNFWPALNDLLWALMTPDRYDYWVAFTTGAHAPAFEVEEVNWSLVGKNLLLGSGGVTGDPYAPWTMFG